MVSIMEKYASNLEALVEERTDQLREEKKKTEELLLQMLPKYAQSITITSFASLLYRKGALL